MNVAILDDYQNVAAAARRLVRRPASRRDHRVQRPLLPTPLQWSSACGPFDAVCVMRERTPLTREILQQLPNLKLIASTGPRNASIETPDRGRSRIAVTATGYDSTPTIEFTWSLILASMRGIDREAASLRVGGWQRDLGSNLRGQKPWGSSGWAISEERSHASVSPSDEGDRLEPEPDRGEGERCRRHSRRQADTVSARRMSSRSISS